MRTCSTILILAMLLSAGRLLAAEDEKQTFELRVSYYKCTEPADPLCCWSTPKNRPKNCPTCKAWTLVTVANETKSIELDSKYSAANDFLDDVAKQTYGNALPETSAGTPITVSQLYQNPTKYGWVELGADQPKEGAIALLPNLAGIVVEEPPKGMPGEAGVLYPSDKKHGALNQIDLKYLINDAKPKFVIPAEEIKAAIATANPNR